MDFRIDHYNIFVAATNDSQCWPGQHRLALAVYLHLSSSSQPAAGNCCWGQLEMSEKVPSVCLSSWGKMNNSLPIRRLGDIGQQKVTMSSSLNSNWLNVSHWQARRRDNAVVTFLQRFLRPLHPAIPSLRTLCNCWCRITLGLLVGKASIQTTKPEMLHSLVEIIWNNK